MWVDVGEGKTGANRLLCCAASQRSNLFAPVRGGWCLYWFGGEPTPANWLWGDFDISRFNEILSFFR